MAEQSLHQNTPIAFVTDDQYALPTAVAIQSLIDHWAGAKPLRIYVLVHEVSENNCERLKRFGSDDVTLTLIESGFDNGSLNRYYDEGSYVSATSMLKFCIARLLPDDDKILYLDGDILVQKDLSPLTQMDVSDYYVAAVEDIAAVKSIFLHTIVGVSRYFNSGVLLLNAKRFRDEALEETMFKIGLEHPEYLCRDQSVFNKGFLEQVLWLTPEWNLMAFNLKHANYSMVLINTFYGTNYVDIAQMEQQAALIHLANKYKPWTYRNAYRCKDWFAVFHRTPFADIHINLLPIVEKTFLSVKAKNKLVEHVLKRLGFIGKDWSPEETRLTIFGATFARKIKQPLLREIRLFGLPVYQIKHDPEFITTKLFGIRIHKYENLEAIANRFDHHIDLMIREKPEAEVWAKEDPNAYSEIRQLQVLDRLKSRRSDEHEDSL